MTKLTDIIEIQISRETSPVSRASFSIPLVLAAHTAFTDRAKEYSDIEAVEEDFATTSNVWKIANKIFAQEIVPEKIVVGRRQVNGLDGSIATVANSTVYTLHLNASTITYTSDSSATAIEIVAGLKTAFTAAAPAGLTMTDNLDGTFDIDATVAGTAFSASSSANIALANKTPSESWVDALTAVTSANNNWFGLVCEDHTDATILALAGAIEAKKKMYGYSTQASAVPTSSTSDIASQLKALGYTKTFGLYHTAADTYFPEAAWIGGQLPETPGSNTWAFKALAGVPVDVISDGATAYLVSKNITSYESIGGVNVTSNVAKVASGEFIDVMVFVAWVEARMRENIWFRLANSKKIPYTAAGLTVIEAEIRKVLSEGIKNGGLAESPAPVVTVPRVDDIDPNVRATRSLEGITFEGRLAGAVHAVKIRGTVTI